MFYQQLNSTSRLERAGDFFLSPLRHLASTAQGKSYDYVQLTNGKESLRFNLHSPCNQYLRFAGGWHSDEPSKCAKIALLVIAAVVTPFCLLLGLLLKGCALLQSDVRKNIFSKEKTVTYLNCAGEGNVKLVNLETGKKTRHNHPTGMQTAADLWKTIKSKDLTGALFEHVVSAPLYYAQWFGGGFDAANTVLPMLNLSECACSNDVHNRRKSNTRQKIENALMTDLNKQFPARHNSNISVLSLGSGKLMQDFLLILKMVQQGYKKIDLHLVDTQNADEQLQKLHEVAEVLLKQGVSLNITWHKDLTNLNAPKFHAVYGIDFDDIQQGENSCWLDLIKSHELLLKGGSSCYSFGKSIFKFDNEGHFNFIESNALTSMFLNYCRPSNHAKGEFCIGFEGIDNIHMSINVLSIIKEAAKSGVKSLQLEICSPSSSKPVLKQSLEALINFVREKSVSVKFKWVSSVKDVKKHYDAVCIFSPQAEFPGTSTPWQKADYIPSLKDTSNLFFIDDSVASSLGTA